MNDGKVISFVIVCAVTRDLWSRRDRVRYLLPSVAFKCVHVRKKHVSLEEVAIVDLICFRSKKYFLQEFLDIKNNFWTKVCCFQLRNMCEGWEK